MKLYAQHNYPMVKLGFSSKYTIAQAGCAITSYGILAEIDPPTANTRVKQANGFVGASIVWGTAAKALGLKYGGYSKTPSYPCIGCTDHYKLSGYPTHYFVCVDANTIIDALDGKIKPSSTYNIISYQLVQPANTLTMEQKARLDRLEQFVSRAIKGKINEYQLPDGAVMQVFLYSDFGDYKDIMQNEEKNLIKGKPQTFPTDIINF